MMKHFTRHLPHYLPLIGIFVAGIIGFYCFSYDRFFQAAISIALIIAYVFWGVVHHFIHKDLYLEVIIEYLIIALLGLVVILSLIFRA